MFVCQRTFEPLLSVVTVYVTIEHTYTQRTAESEVEEEEDLIAIVPVLRGARTKNSGDIVEH